VRKAVTALMILGTGIGVGLAAQAKRLRTTLAQRSARRRAELARWTLQVGLDDATKASRYRQVRLSYRDDHAPRYHLKGVVIRSGRRFTLHELQEHRGEPGEWGRYAPHVARKARRLESRQMSIRHRRRLETNDRFTDAVFFVAVPKKRLLSPSTGVRLRLTVILQEASGKGRSKRVSVSSARIPWSRSEASPWSDPNG
jgi:hypothetical protein